MPTYVLLSTLTPEGRQTLHKNPDRLEAVNKEIEDFGCKIMAQYALLGPYDFISLIEASDNETVAHLAVDLGSRGTVNIMTLPAIPLAQFRDQLKGPKQMVVYQESRHSVGNVPSANLGPFPPILVADWLADRLAGKPFASEHWFVRSNGQIDKRAY